MASPPPNLTEFILRGTLNDRALAAAIPVIMDTLAVMVAGSREDPVARLASSLPRHDGEDGRPSFEPGVTLSPVDAALLYGTAAHALDYDDVSMLAILHPSAPVLAALLSVSDWSQLSGQLICEAHAIGTEVMVRMGQAIGFRHYELGFHSTSTMGVFGASAALARMLNLGPVETEHALAIAASLASGVRSNFGSMVKPIHVGVAASGAVRAISLARAGIQGSPADLLSSEGVLATLSGGEYHGWPDHLTFGAPFAIEQPGFERKRFPCCYLLHKIIAVGLEARENGVQIDDVETFDIEMPAGSTRPLLHPFARSGRQAMFSAPYALLASMLDGDVTFASFTDAAVLRPKLQARFHDVAVREVGDAPLAPEKVGAGPVRLTLQMNDGTARGYVCDVTPGSAGDPLSADESRAKWIDCFHHVTPSIAVERSGLLYDSGLSVFKSPVMGVWVSEVFREVATASAAPARAEVA